MTILFDPLIFYIKIEILICCYYTFSVELLWYINYDLPCVITFLILMLTLFHKTKKDKEKLLADHKKEYRAVN